VVATSLAGVPASADAPAVVDAPRRRLPPKRARRRGLLRGPYGLVLMLVALPFAAALSRDTRTQTAAALAVPAAATASLDRPAGKPVTVAAAELSAQRVVRASRSGNRRPVASQGWVRPGRGVFSSGYKVRWGRMHKGVDFTAPTGSPVYAAADGRVTYAARYSTFGKLILIRHRTGLVTAYAHLSSIDVKVGKKVHAGERIGKVGSTGHSTGPHLHFEVRKNGVQIDPQKFLREHGVWI
jgi:murein DD-endopeptidase MepM/ murein hydrolase activator NlpD